MNYTITKKNIHFLLFLIFCLTLIKSTCGNQGDSVFLVELPHIMVRFNANADIADIESRYTKGNFIKTGALFKGSDNFPLIRLQAPNSPVIDSLLQHTTFTLTTTENDSIIILQFTSNPFLSGMQFTKKYLISKKSPSLELLAAIFDSKGTFKDEDLQFQCSLNSTYNKYRIKIAEKILKLHSGNSEIIDTLKPGQWVGSHVRFFAFCVQAPSCNLPVMIDRESIYFKLPRDSISQPAIRIYCGPIEYRELHKVDNRLTKLLYPLPFWIRWLSFGFYFLFEILLSIIKNVPVSLLLLSVCVKIILAPLFKIASIWQKQVNHLSSLLQPRLDSIKKQYKGEEQTKQTLAVYKELCISPLYSLKSLLSAAIQIPVFFAAYHMLSEHVALSNVSFLWITDLSSPDQLFKLPFAIPFFGSYFNILPFLMTSITIASSWIYTDASLSSVLQKKQRTNLYWMAAIFFFMLYTSPAGMVIYWTTNNLIALITTLFETRVTQEMNLKKQLI